MSLLGDDTVSMESLKIGIGILICFFIFSVTARGEVTGTGITQIAYFNKAFGHLHRRPDVDSSTITVVDCNTVATLMGSHDPWYRVKIGIYEGYIKQDNLAKGSVECFQRKYPRFFEMMKIEPGEQYYWGKLYDRYEQARTKVQ